MIFNMVEAYTMKRSPSSPWNISLHHSISICEVKLKILMETHELQDRLPVWRNKLCVPCFLLCCACFFSHFCSYLVWRFTSMTSGCAKQFTICVGLIVSFILCQGNLIFALKNSWSLDTICQAKLKLCYGNQRCEYTSLWKPNYFLKPVGFFKLIVQS
jgi:hypothetical protein